MNNINELIGIIKDFGNEASLKDIYSRYQEKYKDSLSQAQKTTIIQTLNNNKNLVFLNERKNWELITEKVVTAINSSFDFAIKSFKANLDIAHIEKVENLRKQFVSDFPISNIMNISLNDFIFSPKDKGNNKSFCRRISYDLNELASVGNMYPNVFGIYNKGGSEIQLADNFKNKFGSDYNKAFEYIKKEIIKLLDEIKKENYQYIDRCELNGFFKYRLLIVYFGDKYVPVTADKTINGYCKSLGLKHYEADSIINKNLALLKIKKSFPKLDEMSCFEFMLFCDDLWRNNIIINSSVANSIN